MLKDILARHGVRAVDLGRAIVQSGGRRAGKPLSQAATSLLINHGEYPKATPKEAVDNQIEVFLIGRGVPQAEIEGLRTAAATAARSDEPRRDGPAPNRPQEDKTMLPDASRLTNQARRHFRLSRDPFQDDINEMEDVYLGPGQYEALEAFNEAAQFGRFCAVIGESGSGKSTLRELFEEKSRGQKVQIIRPYITDMADTAAQGRVLKSGQIHEAIIRKLAPGVRVPNSPEARQDRSHRLLCESAGAGYRNVLVFEEAHDLPTQTLKHLKRFWEMKDGLKRVFGILLIGQPELATKLTVRMSWDTREVAQRCAVTKLLPLEVAEIAEYLRLKFARAGADAGALLEDGAAEAIAEHLVRRQAEGRGTARVISEAYPLAINNLVCRALNLCARVGIPTVGPEQIAAAVKEV
jgi:type II secretory pathway predicted ATPase ExeA